MSFKAKFKVGGKEYNVLSCNYSLKQEVDATGRPSSVTRGGIINLEIEATDQTSFFEWMTNSFEQRSGSIVFLKRDTDATAKELTFTEAYMVKYQENFDSTGGNPLVEKLQLSAREIGVGNGEHENEWV